MLKKNKLKILISSIAVLIPMVFGLAVWNSLPDSLTTHWGADGVADGFMNKAFVVFVIPVIFLGLHFICLLFTHLDKKQWNQTPKALELVFWVVPAISIVANGVIYSTALGKSIRTELIVPVLFGLLFLVLGNYLPKVKQNSTLGIRVWWALNNEENWNKTHRFAGKLWVVGGILLLLTLFLPSDILVWAVAIIIAMLIIVPMVYSYLTYIKHQKEGIQYGTDTKSKGEKLLRKLSTALVCVILVGVAIIMFTGELDITCDDDSLKISAPFWNDLNLSYSEIDNITYRKGLDIGSREIGIGSPRLSVGSFKNDEFGEYALYSYTGATEFVVITAGNSTVVVGINDSAQSQAFYDALLTKLAH